MKHSILALPALLRAALTLAAAAASTFSVQDDVLAFPQFEVRFSDDFVWEWQAHARLAGNTEGKDAPGQLEQHHLPDRLRASEGTGTGTEEGPLRYESLLLDGQRYLCSIPHIAPPDTTAAGAANETRSAADEAQEVARAAERGWELLAEMQGSCVYFISGWWSYKFCYNDAVRQFHQLPPARGVPPYPPMEDPGVEGFTLGTYQPGAPMRADDDEAKAAESSAAGELVQRGESRYLVQRLHGGTRCDLTGRERRIEVQFHCNPQSADRISLIKETSTCAYLMVIQTPRLCHDVAFLPPQKDQPNAITCAPVLSSATDLAAYQAVFHALKKDSAATAKLHDAAANIFHNQASGQLVGDVHVGAHALVPLDIKLEKSTIVGGGKETYIDTIASSDGKVLSRDDLEKLGVGDAKEVEKLKKQLEKIAQGEDWKLDLIQTPRGREYRGIIGSDNDDESAEKEKEGKKGTKGAKAVKTKADEDEREGSQEEYYKEEL